ncbi:hypothetical protein BCR36DRAFT_359825 [Piromyces finnis]|uniref:C3H1-type domain-containing protein n=1 Tax=Piromyces finnis TaxID=1754191 RepID=A0A1Y1UZZ1_9FUNG|nr:hypothetical protein BCR36DRAFT_359825 [Piromyces finnis]|eukprot:ORX44335.1 hypothetical protein BCR36DRAFT_359825 [Piromyces finnis]
MIEEFYQLTQEIIHTKFHTIFFENNPENLYCIKDVQIVHKRRVSKRLYFFDARFCESTNEICETCKKVSFILKFPELDIENIHNIQKNIKLGDKFNIVCWVENMTKYNETELNDKSNTIENNILFHIKEIELVKKYDNKIAFVPELPIIEKRNKINKKTNIENEENKENLKAVETKDIIPEEEKKGICKFWLNGKNCLRGSDCPFLHITNEEMKKQWIDKRLNKRKFNYNNKDDFIDPHDKVGHSKRACVFANWLVEHFGKDYLNSGSGVLDIAGGRGATSFELTIKHKVHSTLLEPRPAKLDKKQMRLLYDLKKKEIQENKNSNNEIENVFLNKELAQNQNKEVNKYSSNEINDCDKNNSDDNSKPKRFKLKKNVKIDIPFSQIQCMVNHDTPNHQKHLFNNSSILIGLHPDQATEIIVDLALKLKKPFAIIPCCVFANDFPHRKLKRKRSENAENGNDYEEILVSSYEQFVEYLCEKDKDIQKTFLPFEGKNLLLYKDKKS